MATQKIPLPFAQLARAETERTIEDIFPQDYVDRAFEDINLPTSGELEDLEAYSTALAGASAGQVLTASGPGVAGFTGLTLPPSLSDYSKVIVVDAGGNGDFTTVAEAMAEVVDATVIFVFGDVVEPGYMEVTEKVAIVIYGSWTTNSSSIDGGIYITDGGSRAGELSIIGGSVVADFPGASLTYSGRLSLHNCKLTLIDSPLSVQTNYNIDILSSEVTRTGSNTIVLGGSGLLYINSSIIRGGSTVAPGSAIHSTANAGIINGLIMNSLVEGTAATKQAIRFSAVQNGMYALNNRFFGNVTGAAGFTSANFYNNVFQGTVTNLTGNSGTANGTNTTIS